MMTDTDEGGFVKHQKGYYGAAALNAPAFTIYQSGSGRFNAAACEEFLDDVDAITYYTNTATGELGIGFGGSDDAYKLTHQSSGGAECSMRSVLNTYGVRVDDLVQEVDA
ncbi:MULTISPECIES: hypothetical protein [Halorussus]|uniref:hypothetical protein n=1 Tax=Halorussus TaxID=1070314 RepID=UPI0020A1AE01|nr:hypothetical protein [Halorussus vallis]USZ75691.1 hypothetical protein NGM07_19965 [Halorussus vallis]USZ75766.1 hypothetical protein NGM07_00200 [Halorussus vallis]